MLLKVYIRPLSCSHTSFYLLLFTHLQSGGQVKLMRSHLFSQGTVEPKSNGNQKKKSGKKAAKSTTVQTTPAPTAVSNQILLQCDLCDFRTTDNNLIQQHLAEYHSS